MSDNCQVDRCGAFVYLLVQKLLEELFCTLSLSGHIVFQRFTLNEDLQGHAK